MDVEDHWEHGAHHDHVSPSTESRRKIAENQDKEKLGQRSRSLYEEYGTNEPYTELEDVELYYYRHTDAFFKYVCRIPNLRVIR